MSSTDLADLLWRKSSYSNGQANCVEVATMTYGPTRVVVRDSKAPDGTRLMFTSRTWQRFANNVEGVEKAGWSTPT